jgi:hypothetical protein
MDGLEKQNMLPFCPFFEGLGAKGDVVALLRYVFKSVFIQSVFPSTNSAPRRTARVTLDRTCPSCLATSAPGIFK